MLLQSIVAAQYCLHIGTRYRGVLCYGRLRQWAVLRKHVVHGITASLFTFRQALGLMERTRVGRHNGHSVSLSPSSPVLACHELIHYVSGGAVRAYLPQFSTCA